MAKLFAVLASLLGLVVTPQIALAGSRVSAAEHAQTVAAMKPPKRTLPVVAVLGSSPSAETTDYVVPYSVLARSRIAKVLALSIEEGPLRLGPGMLVRPHMTTREFDADYPDGADYIIVPALSEANKPAALAWVKAQASKGAILVGICSGVQTLSAAGLLSNRRWTSLWEDVPDIKKANPSATWVRNRRYVADQGVVTTTGVSASLPASLALVEAIGGKESASEVAAELGIDTWDAFHDSSAFQASPRLEKAKAAAGRQRPQRQKIATEITSGIDELALAFTIDAWARTRWERAATFSSVPGEVTTRNGLILLPDHVGSSPADHKVVSVPGGKPGRALQESLRSIDAMYGKEEAWFISRMLEYPFGE